MMGAAEQWGQGFKVGRQEGGRVRTSNIFILLSAQRIAA